ncbi:MAG: hypothetical protein ACI3ZV_06530 [Paludibacteraceae bacterium]
MEKTEGKKKEVVISNSKLNSYGFRVLTEGIDTTQYARNPILLWMHNRPFRGTTDEVLPIGRMENLRIDGDNLIGTPIFDEKDEFAQRIAAKWDAGILKMASAGLEVIELSDDPSMLVQGQRRSTVTKSKLTEVSIVDIGANDDALALYKDGKTITLSAGDSQELDFMNINTNPKTKAQMKKIALQLGLPENATEQEIAVAIAQLQKDASETVQLRKNAEQAAEKAIETAVDEAIKLRKITADKKGHFVAIGKKVGLESLNETLQLMQPAARPTDAIHQETLNAGEYTKLSDVPVDKLETLRKDNFAEYAKLYKAEYGIDPAKE